MLNEWQSEQLLEKLSSFYQDHLPMDNQLLELYDLYARTIDYVWNVYHEANDSRFVSTTRTLETIPYAKIHLNNAAYDLNTARRLSRMTFDEQIRELDDEGLYTELHFGRYDASGPPIIYSLRLFVGFGDDEPLELYKDYFVRANRVYLLPHYIQNRTRTVYHMHAFDVKKLSHTLEKNFGSLFRMEVGPLLPRYEYRDVLEAFIRVFQDDMTIKSIRENIQLATKWRNFALHDYKSPFISTQKKRLYDDWVISPLRFLLVLPESAIQDKVKVNIVRSMLHEVKESQTDFMIFFDIHRIDGHTLPMERYPTIDVHKIESVTPQDYSEENKVLLKFVEHPLDVAGRYDTSFYYNFNLQYDDPPANEIISIKQKEQFEDVSNNNYSQAKIRFNAVMIPRNFQSSSDGEGSPVYLSVSNADDNAYRYELFGGATEEGPYHLIESQNKPNEDQLEVVFETDARETPYTFFKVRNRDTDGNYSLYSLPINI